MCTKCGRRFIEEKTRDDHVLRHKYMRYKCPGNKCGHEFEELTNLKRHYGRNHNSKVNDKQARNCKINNVTDDIDKIRDTKRKDDGKTEKDVNALRKDDTESNAASSCQNTFGPDDDANEVIDDGDNAEEQDHHSTHMALHEETSGELYTSPLITEKFDDGNRENSESSIQKPPAHENDADANQERRSVNTDLFQVMTDYTVSDEVIAAPVEVMTDYIVTEEVIVRTTFSEHGAAGSSSAEIEDQTQRPGKRHHFGVSYEQDRADISRTHHGIPQKREKI